MNLLLIVLFSFLAAMSLIIVMFFVPMAVQNSPRPESKDGSRRLAVPDMLPEPMYRTY